MTGDRYGGEWPREQFRRHGVSYEPCERSKSDLYIDFLAIMNSETVALIEHERLHRQLISLERRTARGGRDTIDHPRGGRDDVANAVAGVAILAQDAGSPIPYWRLPAVGIGNDWDPLGTSEENAIAMAAAERRSGYFTGPGWAPTWHGDEHFPARSEMAQDVSGGAAARGVAVHAKTHQ